MLICLSNLSTVNIDRQILDSKPLDLLQVFKPEYVMVPVVSAYNRALRSISKPNKSTRELYCVLILYKISTLYGMLVRTLWDTRCREQFYQEGLPNDRYLNFWW